MNFFDEEYIEAYKCAASRNKLRPATPVIDPGEPINSKEYQVLEYGCTSRLTDEDMLRIRIDCALDSNNKELFLELTKSSYILK